MTELDIWQAANILLHRFGAKADFIAIRKANDLLDKNDADGCYAWIRIAKAIKNLEGNHASKYGALH